MKPSNKDKAVSKAWVAQWEDGDIGWLLPHSIQHGFDQGPDSQQHDEASRFGEPITLYRCRITVERLKDKRGRYITKRIGGA